MTTLEHKITLGLEAAAQAITNGQIIAYPTEAVFGLGCDPFCDDALTRLRQLKTRRKEQGFICIASRWEQVAHWTSPIPMKSLETVLSSWPGPHTWIFPASPSAPQGCIAADNTIALRISAHPVVIHLCDKLDAGLVSTSANPAALAPALNVDEVLTYFDGQIAGVLPGYVDEHASPSTIRNACTGERLR